MLRRHFELERGYLNIDEHGLAFTRSGNWQHAREAPERMRRQRPRRDVHQLAGYALMLLGGLFSGLMKAGRSEVTITLAVGLIGLGAFKLYQALRHDLAEKFRIPFSRIHELIDADGRLTIRFMNGDLAEDEHAVSAPPEARALAMDAWNASRTR